MRPYTYAVANSVSAATSRTGATFLAGGTTLVDLMKLEVLTLLSRWSTSTACR